MVYDSDKTTVAAIILGEREILCCVVCGCGGKASARQTNPCTSWSHGFCRRGVFSAAVLVRLETPAFYVLRSSAFSPCTLWSQARFNLF